MAEPQPRRRQRAAEDINDLPGKSRQELRPGGNSPLTPEADTASSLTAESMERRRTEWLQVFPTLGDLEAREC